MEFKEIEMKYDADEIKLEDFKKAILENNLPISKHLLVSSYDAYFTNDKNEFIRYRFTADRGELTIKRKTSERSNIERVEVNISTDGDNLEAVTAFNELLGYHHNFTIYKTCDIYWTGKVDLVYYVVYDKEFKELRRFIEIEALESAEWESEEEAWKEISKYEKMLEPLGITPKNRLRKSLFEVFSK
jgi:adenylate cyclase class IV